MRRHRINRERIAYDLGLPAEALGCFAVCIAGNRLIKIENFSRLLLLTDTVARVSTGDGTVTVTGIGLRAAELAEYSFTLTGQIVSVRYGDE